MSNRHISAKLPTSTEPILSSSWLKNAAFFVHMMRAWMGVTFDSSPLESVLPVVSSTRVMA